MRTSGSRSCWWWRWWSHHHACWQCGSVSQSAGTVLWSAFQSQQSAASAVMVPRSPYPGWCLEFLIVSGMPHSRCGDSVSHTTGYLPLGHLCLNDKSVTWWYRGAYMLTPDNPQVILANEVWSGNVLILVKIVTSQDCPVHVHLSDMLTPIQHPYVPLFSNKKCQLLSNMETLEQVLRVGIISHPQGYLEIYGNF